MEKVLVMTFETESGKDLTVKVRDILDNLTSEKVKAVMAYAISKAIFTVNGMPIFKVLKAEVVETQKTVLEVA
ncbi:MAG: DUF2922 domain-containing protein [Clostridium sp.]|uniref:DUF2922 domain-containing protein n=1 Tax=Clostridium sp. TaxID=1506 RepID=UPI003F35C75C